jgi:hemerythrin
MPYTWSATLESGVPIIDEQHKRLFAAVNDFQQAFSSGQGGDHIRKTLDFLVNYTAEHFRDEEALQIQYDFPDYMRHRQLHNDFTRTVVGLVDRFNREGASGNLMLEMYETVGDWLMHHIQSDDFVVAAFIRECEQE